MTVFLTPSGEPFYAGTYFPPTRRGQTPAFLDVVLAVSETWRTRSDDVRAQAEQVVARMDALRDRLPVGDLPASEQGSSAAVTSLTRQFDYARGGFGGAPKFPPSMVLEFLLRRHARTGDADALLMAEGTMRAMAGGGLYDQLGGGFARYSVDADWVVPHFEKMLYDNALLARVALHLWQLCGRDLGRRVAHETADFLVAELGTPEGGFASSLDADSEGVEGKFYVWTPAELVDVLGSDDGTWAAEVLGVTDEGTFERGWSTLQLRRQPDDWSRWQRLRVALLAARSRRPRPARDDKVVAGWNGLAVAALAEIGVASGRPDLLDAASGAATLMWQLHWRDGRLLRVSRDGVAADAPGVLEDYAGATEGWLTLYQATGDVYWFERAMTCLDTAVDIFAGEGGTFFDTASDAEQLVRRPQEWTDNATPCGQSLLAGAQLTAAALSGEAARRASVEGQLRAAQPYASQAPRFAGWWLAVAEAWLDGPREVAVVGPKDARASLLEEAWSWPAAGRVVATAESSDDRVGLLRGRETDVAKAWVCRELRCELPTADVGVLREQLRGGQS